MGINKFFFVGMFVQKVSRFRLFWAVWKLGEGCREAPRFVKDWMKSFKNKLNLKIAMSNFERHYLPFCCKLSDAVYQPTFFKKFHLLSNFPYLTANRPQCVAFIKHDFEDSFLWPASRFNGAFPCWWQSYQSVSFLLFFVDVLFLSKLFYSAAKRRTFSIVKNFNKIPIRVIRLRRSFAADCWINQFWFECKTSTLIMFYFRRLGNFWNAR